MMTNPRHGFNFRYRIGNYTGVVTAVSVRAAVSQAKLAWARQALSPGYSMAYYQSQGNNRVKDHEVHLECPAATPEALEKLQREIHIGVTQENKDMQAEKERLSLLQKISSELAKFK